MPQGGLLNGMNREAGRGDNMRERAEEDPRKTCTADRPLEFLMRPQRPPYFEPDRATLCHRIRELRRKLSLSWAEKQLTRVLRYECSVIMSS